MCGGQQTQAMHDYVGDRNKPEGERKYSSRKDVNGIDLDKLGTSRTPHDLNSVRADNLSSTSSKARNAPTLGTPRAATKKTVLTGA